MIQLNAVHQYNLVTTNTDFKMFGSQTNFGISTAGMFYMQMTEHEIPMFYIEFQFLDTSCF